MNSVAQFLTKLRSTFTRLSTLPIPTISAISSTAFGGGLELGLCTNFRVLASTATVGLPETRLAIIPGAGKFYCDTTSNLTQQQLTTTRWNLPTPRSDRTRPCSRPDPHRPPRLRPRSLLHGPRRPLGGSERGRSESTRRRPRQSPGPSRRHGERHLRRRSNCHSRGSASRQRLGEGREQREHGIRDGAAYCRPHGGFDCFW